MKAQNKEEKLAKQQEREKLQREIQAREKAEKIQAEYEDRLKRMQADMMARQKELLDAQNIIKQLEEQLKETQVSTPMLFRLFDVVLRYNNVKIVINCIFFPGCQRRVGSFPTWAGGDDAEAWREQIDGGRGKGKVSNAIQTHLHSNAGVSIDNNFTKKKHFVPISGEKS